MFTVNSNTQTAITILITDIIATPVIDSCIYYHRVNNVLFTTLLMPKLTGASRRIRTSDRSVRSRVLYPAELWMQTISGDEGGIRTLDTAFDRILP